MAVDKTNYKQLNVGQAYTMPVGQLDNLLIDLRNELDTGDFLLTVIATTTSSGIEINGAAPRLATGVFEHPHQQYVRLKPTAVGVHPIKLTSTTQNGLTIVKHFVVHSKE